MRGHVNADCQLAFEHGLSQRYAVGDQAADGVDTDVEVVLDLVEVALIDLGDLGRDIAFGDAIHVLGGDVQGLDDVVQRQVEAFQDFLEVALVFGHVGADRQLAFQHGLG